MNRLLKNLIIVLIACVSTSMSSQTVNLNYELVSYNSNQIIYSVKLTNTTPLSGTMKIAAMNNVMTVTTGTLPSAGTTQTWVEAAPFAGLTNPVLGMSSAPVRIRSTNNSPVTEPNAVDLPNGTEVLFGTWTINTVTPMTFPLTLTPTNSGNPQIQLVNYLNGSTNSNTITLVAGSITLTEPTEVLTAPAPIKLSDFDATAEGKRNRINWTTESEYNNDVQIVEASKDGFSAWRQVARVISKNSWNGASYEVFDNNPGLLTYYRIHSIDLDGREEYSYVISVQRESIITSRLRGISPIPANDVLNLDLELASDMNVEYRIIDAAGKVVAANIVNLSQGNNVQTIDIATLASGSYTVILSGDTLSATEQFVKQ